jgi:hypothetical protein
VKAIATPVVALCAPSALNNGATDATPVPEQLIVPLPEVASENTVIVPP